MIKKYQTTGFDRSALAVPEQVRVSGRTEGRQIFYGLTKPDVLELIRAAECWPEQAHHSAA